MGDSLSDSGTFGYKFTVQNATLTGAGSNQVWAERVAGLYNISLCPRFNGTAFTPNTACNNYAVGGGRINYTSAPTAPISITQQILLAGAAGFTADDLADRKSTRLNSSHLVISYAVFCLKKKQQH